MNPETKNIDTTSAPVAAAPVASTASTTAAPAAGAAAGAPRGGRDSRDSRGGSAGGRGGRGGSRKPDTRAPRAKPEYDSATLNIRRVSRTVSGGRRFAFSVAMIAGNRKGSVGVGLGKAGDTAMAIDKALRDAKKNMVKINLTKEMSIPHEVFCKYSSARVTLRPVKDRGLVAGSACRTVLELAGITNIAAKIISPSKNKLNIARATIEALKSLNLVRPTKSAK